MANMGEASTKNSGAQAEALKFRSGAVDSPFQCLKDEKKRSEKYENKGILRNVLSNSTKEYSYSEYHWRERKRTKRRDRSGASFRSLTITVCSSISCSSRSCRLQIQEGTWSLLEKPRATRQQPGSPKQQRFHQTNTQRVYQRSSPLPSDNSHFFCIQGTGRLHTFIYNWPQQKEVRLLQVTADFCGHKRRTYLEDPCFHASFPPPHTSQNRFGEANVDNMFKLSRFPNMVKGTKNRSWQHRNPCAQLMAESAKVEALHPFVCQPWVTYGN